MDPLGDDNYRKIRRLSLILYSGVVVLVAVVMTLGYIHLNGINDAPTFDPLGDFDTQTVTELETLSDGTKAVYVNRSIDVEGIKCNDSDKDVEITGTITWQAIEPRGFIHPTGEATRTAVPGCTSFSFKNAIPFEVKVAVEAQHNAGIEHPVWRIVGTEWPLDEDGHKGSPRRFETENFVILAAED